VPKIDGLKAVKIIHQELHQFATKFNCQGVFDERKLERRIKKIKQIKNALIKHPRGDYQLLVKVALEFLGHPNVKLGISNMLPVSHARWMSKIIYCFYIYLFRNHYDLPSTSKITTKTLSEVCVFGVTSYIFYFLQCPDARSAPRRDLELLKAIFSFDCDQTKMAVWNKF
jgi:hypothetical protein